MSLIYLGKESNIFREEGLWGRDVKEMKELVYLN